MASRGVAQDLCEEVTCPICLEHFEDPVTVAECGHNFCRACLTRSWGEAAAAAAEASCPLCRGSARPGSLRPNRQLANIVEIARRLSLQRGEATKGEAGEGSCEKHREPLKLFCRDDEVLICTVCDKSKEHKTHEVIPAEEAAPEYKDKIFNRLKTLRTEKQEILKSLADVENESQNMLKTTESERQKAIADFRTLHQWLKELENQLLAQIEEVEKEVAQKREELLARHSEKLSSLESLIREMEGKLQQPACGLLQDVRSIMQPSVDPIPSRHSFFESLWKLFMKPRVFPSELEQRVRNCCYDSFLDSAMKQFKDALAWAFPKQRAKVTLKQASASFHLVLSKDRRSMTWRSTAQDLFGSEGFTAGCHFWEVFVGREGDWAVGVARKSVKAGVTLTPEEGTWAVGRWKGQYKAFIKGIDPPLTLTLSKEFSKIRVCLNYDGGQVAFFDADRAALLYEFSGASFLGEALHPFFV